MEVCEKPERKCADGNHRLYLLFCTLTATNVLVAIKEISYFSLQLQSVTLCCFNGGAPSVTLPTTPC